MEGVNEVQGKREKPRPPGGAARRASAFPPERDPLGLRSPQKTKRTAKFFGSPAKSSPWPSEQAPLALGCPARSGAEKEKKP
jgi:hypothetical protein